VSAMQPILGCRGLICQQVSAMVPLQVIDRALHASGFSVQDVRVDRGRLDIIVTQKLLYGSDIVAIHQERGAKVCLTCGRLAPLPR
jgi:hypothetical protein